jgi:hypothetical protein
LSWFFASAAATRIPAADPRQEGIKKLKVQLKTATSGTLRVAVLFTPDGAPTTTISPRPLSEWKTLGPMK